MSENQNPESPSNSRDEALVCALETLIEERSSPSGSPRDGQAGTAGACPEPRKWTDLMGGKARPVEADALLAHAAGCPACAGRLHMLAADASSEEAEAIAGLHAASRDWQRNLAVKLARTPRRTSSLRMPRLYLWAGAAMAASLLLASVVLLWWQRANTPERQLAEAYTHSRIFELRMPGAGFAYVTPEKHLRGGSTGHESPWLLEARARIAHRLEEAPQDTHWLQLEARADVLEEKFDPAIDILDRLLAAGPVTAGLLVDDAAAYFQRGVAMGSENDRATALEYLRHADELAPGDTLVLFNEAIVMEDRGQAMNAVETWNRYLRFERDPRWQAEARRRLQALEEKLNRLKTHQSRMEQHLRTPQAMRDLASDTGALAAIDEELSSTLLPRLLNAAFPMPVDRSRGSPCEESCQATRALLHSLAASLEQNHQDPWLTQLLPSGSTPNDESFHQAIQALAQAIGADVEGDYLSAGQSARKAAGFFHDLGNAAGEDRAAAELSYAMSRSSNFPACYQAVHPLLGRDPQFAWIQIHGLTQNALCDPTPGAVSESNPAFLRAVTLAHGRGYVLLELRARNLLGSPAVDSGDSEEAWRVYLTTVRQFYSGDYPAIRLYATLSGLEQVEESTPRVRLALLLQREAVGVLEMTSARELVPPERFKLASVAIRAGAIAEAKSSMKAAQDELTAVGGGESVQGFLAENEMAMARFYLEHRDPSAAAKMLDSAQERIAREQNTYHRRDYAVVRGELELAEGHPDQSESLLRESVLEEERMSRKGGEESIVLAQQDRDLYAVLAGVWLAQGRPPLDILALWERYRLRILGLPVPACPAKGLDCLKPRLREALGHLGNDRLLGQIVLFDRLLLYRAGPQGVVWSQAPIPSEDVLAAARPLELAVTSPATPMNEVDHAARRVGEMLLGPENGIDVPRASNAELLLEPDPLLGNLPWPSVETPSGPIGLVFNLAESPSLLLRRPVADRRAPSGKALVVGASIASGQSQLLPEVLTEAKAVARFGDGANLLLAGSATEAQVAGRLETASAIHFAGHAAQQEGGTRLLLAPAQMGLKGVSKPYLDSALLRKHPPRAAQVAVFSACSTGKKEEGWNHGMDDIVDTLALLGVPDVVATRWQIDSESAVPMMDAFYGGLAQGLSVPQALTTARQTLIRDSRYRHPYYWAAYYASGFGRSDLRGVFHTVN